MATVRDCGQEILVQQSSALQTIFENLPWGIVAADQQGRVLFSNPAAEKILGVGRVEVLPDTRASLAAWYLADQVSVVSPDQLPLVRAIRGEEIVDELFFVCNFPQRPGVWIRADGWPLKDPDGTLSGGVVMVHDSLRAARRFKPSHCFPGLWSKRRTASSSPTHRASSNT